jgi:manganese transport protein
LKSFIKDFEASEHHPEFEALEIFKYIGPGLLVTIGFIDPGNWASDLAAGANYGYLLLWMITLSTIILIILQHNIAHLGIATGLCLSEARDLIIQAHDLLSQAQAKNLDTGACEILFNEANELLTKAKASRTNPIYANNLALQALEKLKQAIDCLKALLS